MKLDFKPYRDEMIISTKAGHYMWEGPAENGGPENISLQVWTKVKENGA